MPAARTRVRPRARPRGSGSVVVSSRSPPFVWYVSLRRCSAHVTLRGGSSPRVTDAGDDRRAPSDFRLGCRVTRPLIAIREPATMWVFVSWRYRKSCTRTHGVGFPLHFNLFQNVGAKPLRAPSTIRVRQSEIRRRKTTPPRERGSLFALARRTATALASHVRVPARSAEAREMGSRPQGDPDATRPNLAQSRKARGAPHRDRRRRPPRDGGDDQRPRAGPLPDRHGARRRGADRRSVVPGHLPERRPRRRADHAQRRADGGDEEGALRPHRRAGSPPPA